MARYPTCVHRTGPLLLLLAAGAAAADPLLPPSAADVEGARALALSAYRGLPGNNDEILVNPAALAARRRYTTELSYAQERVGGSREAQWLQASVVDSQTSAATGGFAYTRLVEGPSTGSLYHLALAAPLGGGLHLGATGKFLDLRGPGDRRTAAATVDAGMYWQASQLVGLGVVGYDLVPIGNPVDAPPALGAGLSIGDEQHFRVAADWRQDWERRGKRTESWRFGAELLLAESFPVRGGFVHDGTRGGNSWSAGLGAVAGAGVALDLSYRQSVGRPLDRVFAAALKLQLL
jgi:hypothetical protein